MSSQPPAETPSIIENRRARRRREKRDSKDRQDTEQTSGSTVVTNASSPNHIHVKPEEPTPFEEDFIPFVFPDESDEEGGPSGTYSKSGPGSPRGNDKGKGKAQDPISSPDAERVDKPKGRDQTPPRARDRERDRITVRERSRERERERSRDRDRNREKYRDRERDRDRDRDGYGDRNGEGIHKRKYEMVFDPNDGYANKKQRTNASSRKAPWVVDLNWDRCNNVAEMCVFHSVMNAFA
jgi:non-canonical poly(A) RNA polymerase PAPD5/7